MKRFFLLFIVIGCVSMILSSCAKTVVEPDSVELTFDTLKVSQGTVKLVSAKNYNTHQINWSSSDTAIVKIDEEGVVQALRPGIATITASSKIYNATANGVIVVLGITYDIATTQVSDVGVGANGAIYAIGTERVSGTGGFNILKVEGTKYIRLPECAGVRVAVAPDGTPWVVNKSNLIFKYIDDRSPWQVVPGKATDIGIGANGAVYAISTTDASVSGGYSILKWTGTIWDSMADCTGINIAVNPTGVPYVVNKINLAFRFGGTYSWDTLTGVEANDIGIGADGSVFVTSKNADAAIYKLNGNSWIAIPGTNGKRLAVKPNGSLVYIDKNGILQMP